MTATPRFFSPLDAAKHFMRDADGLSMAFLTSRMGDAKKVTAQWCQKVSAKDADQKSIHEPRQMLLSKKEKAASLGNASSNGSRGWLLRMGDGMPLSDSSSDKALKLGPARPSHWAIVRCTADHILES